MIEGKPACDWLTITTFVHAESTRLFNAIAGACNERGKDSRVMQYEGRKWDGGFWGKGIQDGRSHYMMRASGDTANAVINRLSDCPGRCTRMDIQYTMRLPAGYSARALSDKLREAQWEGHKRAITLIEGVGGLDTVYVGSRVSGRYTRIYVKEGDDGRYLRFEVEFKGDYAQHAYDRSCVLGPLAMGDIIKAELEAMPNIDEVAIQEFRREMRAYLVNPIGKGARIPDPNKTLAWLIRQVSPAVYRLLRDHDQGDRVGEIVQEWYEYAQDLDRI